ncbi:MAG: hypothetical protein HQL65_00015 [Magnetococcales bacterium]|nr:hypothetical protein [Magnetococcales bacterium]
MFPKSTFIRCLLFVPVVFLSTHVAAQSPPADAPSGQTSFCTPAEEVVFACRTGQKMVSVCAAKNAGSQQGYLQYRFGKPDSGQALELVWPEKMKPPSAVAVGDTVAFSGGGAAWLRIPKGNYAYVVYNGIGKWGPNGEISTREGLTVERDNKVIANLSCNGGVSTLLGPDLFERLGIQSQGRTFDLPE